MLQKSVVWTGPGRCLQIITEVTLEERPAASWPSWHGRGKRQPIGLRLRLKVIKGRATAPANRSVQRLGPRVVYYSLILKIVNAELNLLRSASWWAPSQGKWSRRDRLPLKLSFRKIQHLCRCGAHLLLGFVHAHPHRLSQGFPRERELAPVHTGQAVDPATRPALSDFPNYHLSNLSSSLSPACAQLTGYNGQAGPRPCLHLPLVGRRMSPKKCPL